MSEQRVTKVPGMLKSVLWCQPFQKICCDTNTTLAVKSGIVLQSYMFLQSPLCQVLEADTILAGISITLHNLLPAPGSSVHASVNWAGYVFVLLLLLSVLCDEKQSGPCCCCRCLWRCSWWWWRSLYFANLHLIWRTSLGDHRYLPTPTEDTSATNGSV
jgi:hypothetical protein